MLLLFLLTLSPSLVHSGSDTPVVLKGEFVCNSQPNFHVSTEVWTDDYSWLSMEDIMSPEQTFEGSSHKVSYKIKLVADQGNGVSFQLFQQIRHNCSQDGSEMEMRLDYEPTTSNGVERTFEQTIELD